VKDDGALSATIRFTSGEQMENVTGYAAHRPTIKTLSGKIGAVRYDQETHIFTAQVLPGTSLEAQIRVAAK
jgi:hypothetical protein